MPNGCCYPNHVNDEDWNHVELVRDDAKRFRDVGRDRLRIQTRYHAESEIQDVKSDEEEQNDTSDSLNKVEPIARIRIGEVVWSCFDRDYQSVYSVIDQRYKDATDLHEQNVWNRLEIFHSVIKVRCAG